MYRYIGILECRYGLGSTGRDDKAYTLLISVTLHNYNYTIDTTIIISSSLARSLGGHISTPQNPLLCCKLLSIAPII